MAGLQGDYLDMNLTVSELDIENKEYFKHCAAHEFHLQKCDECGVIRYPPGAACYNCGSLASRWVPVAGKGTVYSFTATLVPIPGFEDDVPYLLAMIDLDEGVRILANMINVAEDEIEIGMPVRVAFERRADDVKYFCFEPDR